MKKYPAISVIEFSSIAAGISAADVMLKCAPISMIKSGTVSHGKFLILIAGSVASVELAYTEGLTSGKKAILDSVYLPDIHPQVYDAILGGRRPCSGDTIGIIELKTAAATIRATDAGIKEAKVNIVETRIADQIGGKAFSIFTGKIADVAAAVDSAKSSVVNHELWLNDSVVSGLHEGMARQIDTTSRFFPEKPIILSDGEL